MESKGHKEIVWINIERRKEYECAVSEGYGVYGCWL